MFYPKLFPLLVEWDLRQGPHPSPWHAADIQFVPQAIQKISGRRVEAGEGGGGSGVGAGGGTAGAWQYIMELGVSGKASGGPSTGSGGEVGGGEAAVARGRHKAAAITDEVDGGPPHDLVPQSSTGI